MVWLVLALVVLLLLAAVIIYALSTRKTVDGTVRQTPEEARIDSNAAKEAQDITANGDKLKTEVLNADRADLLSRLRDRVRGK